MPVNVCKQKKILFVVAGRVSYQPAVNVTTAAVGIKPRYIKNKASRHTGIRSREQPVMFEGRMVLSCHAPQQPGCTHCIRCHGPCSVARWRWSIQRRHTEATAATMHTRCAPLLQRHGGYAKAAITSRHSAGWLAYAAKCHRSTPRETHMVVAQRGSAAKWQGCCRWHYRHKV